MTSLKSGTENKKEHDQLNTVTASNHILFKHYFVKSFYIELFTMQQDTYNNAKSC